MNNNASCGNRVLGLSFGLSAGLYGMPREVPWRFVARRTAVAPAAVLSKGRHSRREGIALFYPVGGCMANGALPMQCPAEDICLLSDGGGAVGSTAGTSGSG
jgi:hypothetical protein